MREDWHKLIERGKKDLEEIIQKRNSQQQELFKFALLHTEEFIHRLHGPIVPQACTPFSPPPKARKCANNKNIKIKFKRLGPLSLKQQRQERDSQGIYKVQDEIETLISHSIGGHDKEPSDCQDKVLRNKS